MDTARIKASWRQVKGRHSDTELPPSLQSRGPRGQVLYLYFDESGNFDFRESGTPYFLMTCAATNRPFNTSSMLLNLRFDFMEHGLCLEQFHACEDNRDVRLTVYEVINAIPDSYRVYAVYIRKSEVPPEFQTPEAIYSKIFGVLMDEVYRREMRPDVAQVIAITDDLPKDAKRRQVAKPLKAYMKHRFSSCGVPYTLSHHKSCSDPNLQAADYFCWAANRDLTQGKDWPLSQCSASFREVGEARFVSPT